MKNQTVKILIKRNPACGTNTIVSITGAGYVTCDGHTLRAGDVIPDDDVDILASQRNYIVTVTPQ